MKSEHNSKWYSIIPVGPSSIRDLGVHGMQARNHSPISHRCSVCPSLLHYHHFVIIHNHRDPNLTCDHRQSSPFAYIWSRVPQDWHGHSSRTGLIILFTSTFPKYNINYGVCLMSFECESPWPPRLTTSPQVVFHEFFLELSNWI